MEDMPLGSGSTPHTGQSVGNVLTQSLLDTIKSAEPPLETDEAYEQTVLNFAIGTIQHAITSRQSNAPVVSGDMLRKKYREYHENWGTTRDTIAEERRQHYIDASVAHAEEFAIRFPEISVLTAIHNRLRMRELEREARATRVILAIYGMRFASMTGRVARPTYRRVQTEFPDLPD